MKNLIPLITCALIFCSALKAQNPNCDPFFGKLVINEVVPGNDNSGADEFGENDDWVEIYNGSDQTINLEGYFLSDNHGNRTKFVFPDFDLAPNDVVTVWCDDQPTQGPFHTTFRLSGTGEEVGLYNPDTTSLDYVKYGAIPDDIAVGRFPNGQGPFKTLIPTFDALNTNSVQPGLVINEYQSNNETTAQDQWGGFDDWIELYNGGNSPINLGGYFLSDKIGDPTQFEFPDTLLMPDSYIVIWCDQGLFEPGLHTFFQLGGDGDDILLSNPDTLTIDYVRFGIITPDETEGRFPNGSGSMTCLIPTHEATNGDALSTSERERETFVVFPNPSKGLISMENPDNEIGSLQVFSSMGRLVHQENVNGSFVSIDLTFLPKGIYVLNFNQKVSKLVLQ